MPMNGASRKVKNKDQKENEFVKELKRNSLKNKKKDGTGLQRSLMAKVKKSNIQDDIRINMDKDYQYVQISHEWCFIVSTARGNGV